MARNTFSVEIPTNPDFLIALAAQILAKDTELADKSPFKNIKNWAAFADLNGTASSNNDDSKKYAHLSEEATQRRDNALGATGQLREDTVRWFVSSARDVLLGLNKGSEQQLSEYGFNVTYGSTTAAVKPQPATQTKA